jgi:hypothetical protein
MERRLGVLSLLEGRLHLVLKPAAFQRHSDLDLVVEGLPAAAHLEALGVVEQVVIHKI